MTRMTAPSRHRAGWYLVLLNVKDALTATVGIVREPEWCRRLWPLAILGFLALGRWWAIDTNPFYALGLSVCVAAGVAAYLRYRITHREHWYYTITCLTAATLGLFLVAVVGPVRWLNVTSVLGWAGLSTLWWTYRQPAPAPPPASVKETGIIADWNRYVRDRSGPTAGATIADGGAFQHGRDYVINVVPGKQHLGTFESDMKNISTALDIPLHKLLIEQHPDRRSERDPNSESTRILRMRHVTTSPVEKPAFFTGPEVVNGRILLGPYADGMGAASWRVFTPNSMWGGFILGDLGSGKSRLLELLGLVARSMGVFLVYIDGQNGASSPILWEHADWRGGPAEANEILAALIRGKDKRQVHNRVHRLPGFTPSTGLTPILSIVDECHVPFADKADARRWATLNREQRKTGGATVAASQFSGVETFGGHDVLRSSLLAGNAVALRTSSKLSPQLVPGLGIDPALFPTLPGYGYYVDASKEHRTAPFRSEWLPDTQDKLKDPSIPVPTVEEWYQQIPHAVLDEMTASAFGPAFLNRHELAAQRDTADRAWLESNEPEPPGLAQEARPVGDAPAVVAAGSTSPGGWFRR